MDHLWIRESLGHRIDGPGGHVVQCRVVLEAGRDFQVLVAVFMSSLNSRRATTRAALVAKRSSGFSPMTLQKGWNCSSLPTARMNQLSRVGNAS